MLDHPASKLGSP